MADNGSGASEPTWTLGPIAVKRTTDILALVAFILSVIGLVAQVRDYVRGANAVLFAPEQVTFGSSRALQVFFQNNDQFLITTATMSYVNDAPVGFNAAVGREYMRFEVGGKKYQYTAHHVVNTSSETSTLKVVPKDDAGPFALNAGSAVSHEMLFEPHPVKCLADDQDCAGSLPAIKWSEFITAVKSNPIILVTLLAEVYGKSTLSKKCTLTLNNNDLNAFTTQGQEWSAPDCQEEKEPGFWKTISGGGTASPKGNPPK